MKIILALGVLLLALLIIILFPLAVVWALNTLFHLAIPYDIYAWLAVIILGAFFHSSKVKK
jgi:hypothetical protein